MLNALHICSNVRMIGSLFLETMLESVDCAISETLDHL